MFKMAYESVKIENLGHGPDPRISGIGPNPQKFKIWDQ